MTQLIHTHIPALTRWQQFRKAIQRKHTIFNSHAFSVFNVQPLTINHQWSEHMNRRSVSLCWVTWCAISYSKPSKNHSGNIQRLWAATVLLKSYFTWNKFRWFVYTNISSYARTLLRSPLRETLVSFSLLLRLMPDRWAYKCDNGFIDSFIWYIMWYNFWWCRRWNEYFLKCD